MTAVQIVGGPHDGGTFEAPGSPDPGDSLIRDGHSYRLHQRGGTWVAVWGGYSTAEHLRDVDAERRAFVDELTRDPTDEELARLAAALREHEGRQLRRTRNAFTLTFIGASVGAAAGFALIALAALGWAVEALRDLAGGWLNLVLAMAVLAGVLSLAACAVNWSDLDKIDERTRK